MQKQQAIGIFDSGIGGLTVAKAVAEVLPKENIVYFGDTARVPYGGKSEETVSEYALEITDFLLEKEVKMILIACNTVSAYAKDRIIEKAGAIPVLDVISAGTRAVLNHPKHKNVGVIGTLATVNSEAYVRTIHQQDPTISVIQKACPLLVPLAEEGWVENEIAEKALAIYLKGFVNQNVDSLVLGCTHYPLFKHIIPSILNTKETQIIDSADSIAESAREKLSELHLLNGNGGDFQCFVSDRPQRFHELAQRFLGKPLKQVEIIHL